MKRFIFFLVLIFLLLTPLIKIYPQSLSANEPTHVTFDSAGLPVWVQDLRRWEIVAFGTFPFTLFAVTFVTDMIRWGSANGMDFSDAGRRYAPWPLKSAGAIDMTGEEFQRTVLIAAGLSVALALVDFFIVLNKRNNELKHNESSPSGSVIFHITPPGNDEQEADDSPPLTDNP